MNVINVHGEKVKILIHAFERKKLRLYRPLPEGGHWRTRWNCEIYCLYKDLNIVDYIKIVRIGPACYVIQMEEQMIRRKKRVSSGNFPKQDQ